MNDLVAIGDSCQDVFLILHPEQAELVCTLKPDDCQISFHYGEKIPLQEKYDAVGGNAANAAVSAAKLGLRTAIYTHLGNDRAGLRVREEFSKYGVADDFIVTDSDLATNYNTVLSYKGERTIFSYHQQRHYHLPHIGQAKWLYLTSMKDGFEKIMHDLVTYASANRCKIAYQPGSYQLKLGPTPVTEFLKYTDIIFMNREEAELYAGLPHGATFSDLLKALLTLGPKMAVVTDGNNGTAATDGVAQYYMPVMPEVQKLEATGAGDGFASATTVALVKGLNLKEALRWGQVQASGVIQKVGAQNGLYTIEELQRELTAHESLQAINLDPKL